MKSHIVAIAVAFCLCAASRGAMIDQNWESRFVLSPGFPSQTTAPDNEVRCLGFDATGNLYVGGGFHTVGNVNAPGVARYDGTNWHALGGGLPESYIENLAVVGTNVFVSGDFRPTSGITNLAQWNGTEWVALGSGVTEQGSSASNIRLAAGTTNLFVAGQFDFAGGIAVTNLARWDGSQWHSMDYAPSPDALLASFSYIPTVTAKGDELYICEQAFNFGIGVPNSIRIKKWTAGSWSDLGDALSLAGTSLFLSPITMVCVGTNVFVSGQFFINALSATNIVCWDGVSWSAVGHPFEADTQIWPTISDGTNLFVALHPRGPVGEVKLGKWNGTNWKTLGTGASRPVVRSLAVRGRDLFVGGDFNFAGGKPADYLALWHDFLEVTMVGRGWQPGGAFGLRVFGGKNQPVQVQASTNLQNWLDLGTQLPDSDAYDFEDATASPAKFRCYRLRLIP